MAVRRQERRGTRAQWATANPVLAAGEIGVETDTPGLSQRFKIGNGTDTWDDLAYAGGGNTGRRTIAPSSPTEIGVRVQREGDLVTVNFNTGAETIEDHTIPDIPEGFQPEATTIAVLSEDDGSGIIGYVMAFPGGLLRTYASVGSDEPAPRGVCQFSFTTPQDWSASLPGTPFP